MTSLWHTELKNYGGQFPRLNLIGDALYLYLPGLSRVTLLDARTGEPRWNSPREGLSLDPIDAPMPRHTTAYGDILIARAGRTYHAIRLSDGSDAWTVTAESDKISELANDRLLVVFEPDRHIYAVDLETGKSTGEWNIEQYADSYPAPVPKWLVGAVMQDNRLFVLSKHLDVYAIDLTSRSRGAVLWKTPIQKTLQSMVPHGSRLYLGFDTGDVIVLDVRSGAVLKNITVTGQLQTSDDQPPETFRFTLTRDGNNA